MNKRSTFSVFKYYFNNEGNFPAIPLYISASGKQLKLHALIDSGADVCFCAMDISLWLGINLSKKRRFDFTAANNQTFDTYKEVVTMYVAGKKYDTPFYFSDKLTKNFPLILGQKGFFDHFKVCFDLKNKIMDIS